MISVWQGSKYDSGHKHSNKNIRMRKPPRDTQTQQMKIVTKYKLNEKQGKERRKCVKSAYSHKHWQ